MLRNKKRNYGFTIIELLIVVVVIGILAAIVIVAFSGVQERSKVQKANTDLNTLVKAINVARLNTNKTLMGVTGSGCTRCGGTQAAYNQTIDRIATAAGANLSALKDNDPWGNMYLIDENEGEQVANPCILDSLTVSGAVSHSGLIAPRVDFYNC